MEGFSNLSFTHLWTVGISGIDEVYSQINDLAQQSAGGGGILRLAPNAWSRESHGTEAEAMHRQITTEFKNSTASGFGLRDGVLAHAESYLQMGGFGKRTTTKLICNFEDDYSIALGWMKREDSAD